MLLALVIALLTPVLAPTSGSPASRDRLKKAKECSRRLQASKKRMKYRDQWMRCIRSFESYFSKYPKGRQADEALYASGKLYKGLYGYSGKSGDLNLAIERFRQVVKRFPRSRFADDAQYKLGVIYLRNKKDPERAYVEFFKVVIDFPNGDMKPRAKRRLAELEAKGGKRRSPLELPRIPKVTAATGSSLAKVTDIRHWSAPDYTRVVIDVNKQIRYAGHLLKADPALKTPPRLYIDLQNAVPGSSFNDAIPIGDGLLRKIRAGRYKPGVVRVVLDIESIDQHKIFSLSDPFRIVIDVTGAGGKQMKAASGKSEASRLTLAQQLGLGVKRIVIDPGHGGKDPGAMNSNGIREKDVVLAIAKKLQKRVRRELELEAILTRDADSFLPLEERTALANTKRADLFVSIHTNAHKDRRVHGVSTYILNVATDAEAARLAAFENAVSTKRISDLEKILSDLMLTSKINESSRLALAVQHGLTGELPKKYSKIKNLGVKEAPFYVLIGAQMPSIMVETSFISNPREARRLASSSYQDAVARGILKGIRSYIEQIESVPGPG
ncbi:MAG: N-acetylmuramoyl-L-alanine amidase [Deltaproteobacteria bacterium]|nr:MAG: N-acetylmuramoyl-L-alanine amidase [Deltaproteobacteria bacterium]